eukprot:scpid76315/ scgid5780/ Leucine-rich repeat and calponin homology domain-containing protein 3
MPQSPINNATTSFNVPVEKLFEQAEETGVLVLMGRKLSIFPPTVSSFDLTDVTVIDLSANRFVVLPQAIAEMVSVERLCCYNNVMRTLPPLGNLQSLVSLNVSRNHLTALPAHTCSLPLKELNISHNRLVSLPDELGQLKALMDLDVSGNELVTLPSCIGELSNLRDLNVRRNHLQNLPDELTALNLVRLDISVNRVSRLPLSFIKMQTLRSLILHNNPMVLPPTNVCLRGRVHIMKYLQAEIEQSSCKDDISVRSSRAAARRENRANQARRTAREKEAGSPRSGPASLSLEAEMENVAKQHGLDWSAGGRGRSATSSAAVSTAPPARKPNVVIHNAGMVASSTTVSAGGIVPKGSPRVAKK